jgi:hypothetical protein
MARKFVGMLLVLVALAAVGCSSSQPMRFKFNVPSGSAALEIDEGDVVSGNTSTVYSLSTNDVQKKLKMTVGGKTVYGRMDVFEHTALTRMSVVPITLSGDIINAVQDSKVVTYVVYQRNRDQGTRGMAGEDSAMRIYDYGDSVSREALLNQARLNGNIIAVIDFGNAEYLEE